MKNIKEVLLEGESATLKCGDAIRLTPICTKRSFRRLWIKLAIVKFNIRFLMP